MDITQTIDVSGLPGEFVQNLIQQVEEKRQAIRPQAGLPPEEWIARLKKSVAEHGFEGAPIQDRRESLYADDRS